ncbi:MAG: Transcriptional regulator, HxlR family, partial [Actinomycetia bacterium]|nr:Transcriptional regulator, HxlR family [Actinomycetes bacterium]
SGAVGGDGTCGSCGQAVPVQDLLVAPGPGLASKPGGPDPVSASLASRHRLLEPVRA